MLNDNIMFLNHFDLPFSGRSNYIQRRPYTYYSNHDLFEREYLAELQEREERRRYQAALEQQAYLEAMERKRQQKLQEERRRKQYLLELERRKRQDQEEELLRRQYLAHLEQMRQEKIKQDMIRKRKAEALQALKRKEVERQRLLAENAKRPIQHKIVRGSDGNLYMIQIDPFSESPRKRKSNENQINLDTNYQKLLSPLHDENETDESSIHMSLQPQVTFKNCFNINKISGNPERDNDTSTKTPETVKSSVLIGDVEDASDSENEDEFSDYMHNRRPTVGEWIEPIEAMSISKH